MDDDDEIARATRARKGSPFLTAKQAAFFLGLQVKTLTNMRWRGNGPPFRRHGGQVRYHIDELEQWSRTNRRKGKRGA
jgi:hypothetical protein